MATLMETICPDCESLTRLYTKDEALEIVPSELAEQICNCDDDELFIICPVCSDLGDDTEDA